MPEPSNISTEDFYEFIMNEIETRDKDKQDLVGGEDCDALILLHVGDKNLRYCATNPPRLAQMLVHHFYDAPSYISEIHTGAAAIASGLIKMRKEKGLPDDINPNDIQGDDDDNMEMIMGKLMLQNALVRAYKDRLPDKTDE